MNKIAAIIPGLKDVFTCNPVNNQNCPSPIPRAAGAQNFTNLTSVLSGFLNIAFYAAFFLAFFYLIWAAFSYITAQGKKEELQKATARITWAIIGLIIVFLAYFIARFVGEILPPKGGLPF